MQVALVSDIHANIQAWNGVLLDIRSLALDSIICLGDVVGYGPNPAEVLSSVHSNIDHLVLGNHDAVICGKLSPDLFNDEAAQCIEWTKTRLNSKAVRFLGSLPLTLDCGAFRCSHGDMADPSAFKYIQQADDAMASWKNTAGNLFFVGHTHEPVIFILGDSGIPREVPLQDFVVESDRRYVVNPGSVGQPRDGMALASYCIFDTESNAVFHRRVPFDIDQYRSSLAAAGLDESTSGFLAYDPRKNTCLAREITDFSPARNDSERATGAVEIQEFDILRTHARRWKRSFAAILILMIAMLISSAGVLAYHLTKKMYIPARTEINSGGEWLASLKLEDAPYLPLSDFAIEVGNRRRQTLSIVQDEEVPIISLNSGKSDPVILMSPQIPVKAGDRLMLEAMVRKSDNFKGSAGAFVSVIREVDGNRNVTERYIVKEPNVMRKNGFLSGKQTFDVPARTTHVIIGFRAEFTGALEIAALSLTRRD